MLRKKIVRLFIKVMNGCAILNVAGTVNKSCFWIFYQPEEPASAEKYKTFKEFDKEGHLKWVLIKKDQGTQESVLLADN